MQVYRARHRHSNELYAIKRSRHRFANRAHREQCLHEVGSQLCTLAHGSALFSVHNIGVLIHACA